MQVRWDAEIADQILDLGALGNGDRLHLAPTDEAPALPTDRAAVSERSVDEDTRYVRVLGPVDALNIAGSDWMPGRGIEFLTYLLVHQQPVPGAQTPKREILRYLTGSIYRHLNTASTTNIQAIRP